MTTKMLLCVPFCEKDQAKTYGAKWDSDLKKWYVSSDNIHLSKILERWEINSDAIDLIGEDRTFGGNALFIDMIPSTCWFTNVRSCIHPSDWDRVRNHVYERASYTCECCNINTKEKTENGGLEAHERWEYDDIEKTQILRRIIALCHQCHQSTHMGLAGILGKSGEAETHLQKVRGFTTNELKLHKNTTSSLWRYRSGFSWRLDISIISQNGIRIIKNIKTEERLTISNNNIDGSRNV